MGVIRHIILFLVYAAVGIVLAGVTAFILYGVKGKPDLSPWHTAPLREEFTREASGRIKTLADYRRLEDRLFEELRREVYEQPAASPTATPNTSRCPATKAWASTAKCSGSFRHGLRLLACHGSASRANRC